ncbi:hypothetical protein DL770_000146 [Monosporascus sp. CRB-9-2]|nr:hypothetical protein DL770_000146 [Monosporascus sp. CRB-9-2]
MSTSKSCSGSFYSGYCPGDSSIRCCVPGGGGASGIAAFDISVGQSNSFWSCARNSAEKVIIRGYRQACGSGGGVDTALLGSYNAARSAGFTNIDIYFFPCTGTQPTGVACKSPQTQVSEIENYISTNGMQIGRIWLDIEPTSGECNAWNLGASANTALARQYASIIRASSYNWGVYANGNQWSGMFGSRSVDVASDLPLWAVQFDRTPGVNTVTTFMGGWTTAYAKQYWLDTTLCGGSVDLNSFLG